MSVAINNQFATSRSHRSAKHVSIRTYRRRRAVVALAFLTVALALSFALPNTLVAAEQGEVANAVSQKYVVAQTGDTLWSIAQRVDPYGNITLLVDQLVIINGGTVTPGQKILLP
jgi:LysM repeat protein